MMNLRERTIASWPERRRMDYEERAAIIQYDGKETREQAERIAFRQNCKEYDDVITT